MKDRMLRSISIEWFQISDWVSIILGPETYVARNRMRLKRQRKMISVKLIALSAIGFQEKLRSYINWFSELACIVSVLSLM